MAWARIILVERARLIHDIAGPNVRPIKILQDL